MEAVLLEIEWDTSNAMRQKVYEDYLKLDTDKSFKKFMRTKLGKGILHNYTEAYFDYCNDQEYKDIRGDNVHVMYLGTKLMNDKQYIKVETNKPHRICYFVSFQGNTSNNFFASYREVSI